MKVDSVNYIGLQLPPASLWELLNLIAHLVPCASSFLDFRLFFRALCLDNAKSQMRFLCLSCSILFSLSISATSQSWKIFHPLDTWRKLPGLHRPWERCAWACPQCAAVEHACAGAVHSGGLAGRGRYLTRAQAK